jgi:UDP-N-acetylglucosamine enolpyruvyl transferase
MNEPANIATAQPSVGTTSTLVVAARTGRAAVTIENLTSTPIYLGASGVTSTTGMLLPGVVGASMTIEGSMAVYGVASVAASVSVLETF